MSQKSVEGALVGKEREIFVCSIEGASQGADCYKRGTCYIKRGNERLGQARLGSAGSR